MNAKDINKDCGSMIKKTVHEELRSSLVVMVCLLLLPLILSFCMTVAILGILKFYVILPWELSGWMKYITPVLLIESYMFFLIIFGIPLSKQGYIK